MNVDFFRPIRPQKAYPQSKIELNRNGAKAKVATAIRLIGSLPPEDEKEVILNRPFVFTILHRTLNIPVFTGMVNKMEKVCNNG